MATSRMNLKYIMLCERSVTKDKSIDIERLVEVA
jgi:hypothetical protein